MRAAHLHFGLVWIVVGVVFMITPAVRALRRGGLEEWLFSLPLHGLLTARVMIALGALMTLWGFLCVLT